jgi:hypothetical protein
MHIPPDNPLAASEDHMPNGGVPMHMVLYPKDGGFVFYCRGGELRIVARDAWDRQKGDAPALCALTKAEAGALASHLGYWLGALVRPGHAMRRDVNAEYDY